MPKVEEQSKHKEIREVTIAKIRDAGLKLFSTKGLTATNIANIAEFAGISPGLMYYYYKSKEDLYVELAETAINGANSVVRDIAAMPVSPGKKVTLLAVEILKKTAEDKNTAYFFVFVPQVLLDNSLPKEKKTLVEEAFVPLDLLKKIIIAGQKSNEIKAGNPEALAILFFSSITGICTYKVIMGERFVFPQANMLTNILLKDASDRKIKKIAIIGGGISGLAAGVYARLQGFEAEIFESHHSTGGECTSWHRKGYNIDGCIHWLTGSKPGTAMRGLWETCGALSSATDIVNHEYIVSYSDEQGKIYHLHSDLHKIEEELLRISPEDRKEIKRFVRIIKAFWKMQMPVEPEDMMSFRAKIRMILPLLPVMKYLKFSMNISTSDYIKRFRSPIIRNLLSGVVPDVLVANALFFTIATRTNGDGGFPLGGSLHFARRMQERFESLGGKVFLKSKVEKIVVENGQAIGIQVYGEKVMRTFDCIVSAVDAHTLLYQLLEGKYSVPYFERRFANDAKYPVVSATLVAIGVKTSLKHRPTNLIFKPKQPVVINGVEYSVLMLNHYAYDSSLAPEGHTLVEFIFLDFNYDRWETLRKKAEDDYQAEKQHIGDLMLSELQQIYPETTNKAQVLDVITPLTYKRYCNAYKGGYMSFLSTAGTKFENYKGVIEGISNLYIAGQWVFSNGGLPLALLAGKFAIQWIEKIEKKIHKN
ncbi:MAG: FAD-dependent oxidoreductase [Prevotellaceae bacterium]|jgi:phytoene dehydrogenase-like protein/AcrR family transcriptional regulator|nr:FAD-dependent oxidoreductase [Prevotellaceae bacterium]